jgi:hypothetical protein
MRGLATIGAIIAILILPELGFPLDDVEDIVVAFFTIVGLMAVYQGLTNSGRKNKK